MTDLRALPAGTPPDLPPVTVPVAVGIVSRHSVLLVPAASDRGNPTEDAAVDACATAAAAVRAELHELRNAVLGASIYLSTVDICEATGLTHAQVHRLVRDESIVCPHWIAPGTL